jgi:hypothetical protein
MHNSGVSGDNVNITNSNLHAQRYRETHNCVISTFVLQVNKRMIRGDGTDNCVISTFLFQVIKRILRADGTECGTECVPYRLSSSTTGRGPQTAVAPGTGLRAPRARRYREHSKAPCL